MFTHNFYTYKDGNGFEVFLTDDNKICSDIVNQDRRNIEDDFPVLCYDIADIEKLIEVLKTLVKKVRE